MKAKTANFKHKFNLPARAAFWFTAAAFFEKGCALIFTPIYTRLLPPSEYGSYALYMSYIGIFSVFVTLEISGNAIYRGLREFEDSKKFIGAATGIILGQVFLSSAVYFLAFDFFDKITELGAKLSLIIFIDCAASGIFAVKLSEKKFLYSTRLFLLYSAANSLAAPLISVFLIKTTSHPELARIYAHLAISLAFAIPVLFSIAKNARFKFFDADIWRFVLKYSLPTVFHYMFVALIFQSGKIFVGKLFSSREVALLAIAGSLGFLPNLFTHGVQSSLIPWINRKLAQTGGDEKIYPIILSILRPLCIIILIFLAFCPEGISILAPRSYSEALTAVYPIAISCAISFLINVFSSVISYYKKTYLVTLGSFCGAACSLILNLSLTLRLGFAFSQLALLLSCAVVLLFYSLIIKFKFRHARLPLWEILICIFLLSISATVLSMLTHSVFARGVFAAALTLLLLPQMKKTAAFIK